MIGSRISFLIVGVVSGVRSAVLLRRKGYREFPALLFLFLFGGAISMYGVARYIAGDLGLRPGGRGAGVAWYQDAFAGLALAGAALAGSLVAASQKNSKQPRSTGPFGRRRVRAAKPVSGLMPLGPHAMSCDCQFEPKDTAQQRVLVTLLVINAAMFLIEVLVGWLADSSGVIADALDMLADALVYGIALYAIGRSARVKAHAARGSGWFQIALAVAVLLDVIRRAIHGSDPASLLMVVVSIVALGANAYCLRLLLKHREGEVHMRASWIFTRSDVIANAGVITAALLVGLTGSRWPDLIIGAAIALVVVHGGISILAEARRDAAEACTSPAPARVNSR